MFISYCKAFRSVSQYYAVLCEHTFLSAFIQSMSLKTLNIILMCFDGKNNHFKKTQEKVHYSLRESIQVHLSTLKRF